jgi:hypothetical protein
MATGWALFDVGLIGSQLAAPMMIPTGAAGAAVTADTTAANIVSIQPLQSGTAGTVTVDWMSVEALN